MRRLAVLVRGLPYTSRFRAALAGDEDGFRWGTTEHLLAVLVDVQQQMARMIYADVTRKRPPPYKPLERPGAGKKVGRELIDEGAAAYLGQFSPGGSGEGTASPLRLVQAGDDAA